jgi:hypothetical protein
MQNEDELIQDTDDALGRPLGLPHQAASIAMNLFLLSQVYGLAEDPRVRDLGRRFKTAVQGAGLESVLSSQLRYAIRLASAPGRLMFEEIHKLFSLCDEVHALRALGFAADTQLLADFEASVSSRFAAQRADACVAAEHDVEPWSRNLWWFANNLP